MFEWKPMNTIPRNGEFYFCWNRHADPDGDRIGMIAWKEGRWIFASDKTNEHPTHWMHTADSAKRSSNGTSVHALGSFVAAFGRRRERNILSEIFRRRTPQTR